MLEWSARDCARTTLASEALSCSSIHISSALNSKHGTLEEVELNSFDYPSNIQFYI